MGRQERYFGTWYQRVLSEPLDVRAHYGHPDVLDTLHFITRGGCASASKRINLSEDVFAGYKTMLRGGRVIHREYHEMGKGRMTNLAEIVGFFSKLTQGAAAQLKSRDVFRLVDQLPTNRRLSLLFGGFSYYIFSALRMQFFFFSYYCTMAFAVLGEANTLFGLPGMAGSLLMMMPILVSLVMMIPDVLQVLLEEGLMQFVVYVAYKFITLSILYFLFIE